MVLSLPISAWPRPAPPLALPTSPGVPPPAVASGCSVVCGSAKLRTGGSGTRKQAREGPDRNCGLTRGILWETRREGAGASPEGRPPRPASRRAQAERRGPEERSGAAPWPWGRLGSQSALSRNLPLALDRPRLPRTWRMRSVSGSSSSRKICSRPAGSMAAAEPTLLGRDGGGTARGGSETHFRRKGRCTAPLPSPG